MTTASTVFKNVQITKLRNSCIYRKKTSLAKAFNNHFLEYMTNMYLEFIFVFPIFVERQPNDIVNC